VLRGAELTGWSRRRRAVAAAVLLVFPVAAGCGGDGGGSTSAAEIAAETAKRTAEVESFRFTLEVKNVPPSANGLSLVHAGGEVMVPDRLHADVSGTFARIPIETELVIVDGKDFFKDPLTGAWRTLDIETNPVALFDPRQGVLAVIKGAEELRVVGSETIRGAACDRIAGKVKASTASGLLAVSTDSDHLVDLDLWAGKEDGILRRVRISGMVASGEPENAARSVDLSGFGATFEITAPEVSE
jgi:hypothetical protein